MSDEYFIMLAEPRWAGPTAFRVAGSETRMNRGKRVREDLGLFEFELRVDEQASDPLAFPPLDLHDPAGGQPLFSRRLIEALREIGVSNIDYYPARVIYEPTGAELDYEVANVIGMVSGLDLDKSNVQVDDAGFVERVRRMVFDESQFEGQDLVRLREKKNLIVISRRVKERIEEKALTGIMIIRDEEWQPGMI
ncbi:MAG: hypothetical protein JSV86_13615 [Gemmatimonadota bacterium]|nr:MAG: hypothetical protein JSV86_13615 [Gemmatimonadota bacterium]